MAAANADVSAVLKGYLWFIGCLQLKHHSAIVPLPLTSSATAMSGEGPSLCVY